MPLLWGCPAATPATPSFIPWSETIGTQTLVLDGTGMAERFAALLGSDTPANIFILRCGAFGPEGAACLGGCVS